MALVSGASRGLGRAISMELTRSGIDVVGVARDMAQLQKTADCCRSCSGGFTARELDVRDEAAVTRAVASVPSLDFCVVNAGIAAVKPFLDTTGADLAEILNVNVRGAFYLMREAARSMSISGRGRIVVIASDAAFRGIAGMSSYVASKHALIGLAKTLDLELAESGVQVTSVLPGPIATTILGGQTPGAQLMAASEVARSIVGVVLGSGDSARVSELHIMPWKEIDV